jgi:hypothetical protein
MSKTLRTFCLGCTLCAAGLIGCDDNDARSDATTGPTVGERVDRGLDKAGDAIDRAADRTGDVVAPAVDDAADRARQAGASIKEGAKEMAADLSGDVYDLLGDVTEDAVTRNELDDLVESFAEPDRTRIGEVREDAFPQLNAEIDAFRQKWQSKYGRDFDIEDDRAVFNFVTVQGDPNDPNRATVTFAARAGMPQVTVPLVRETGGWRVDVPDTLTAQQLADALISGLKPINAGHTPLPDDVMEAYRSSAQGTMAALLGEKRAQQ